jgi:hypothetical protein
LRCGSPDLSLAPAAVANSTPPKDRGTTDCHFAQTRHVMGLPCRPSGRTSSHSTGTCAQTRLRELFLSTARMDELLDERLAHRGGVSEERTGRDEVSGQPLRRRTRAADFMRRKGWAGVDAELAREHGSPGHQAATAEHNW